MNQVFEDGNNYKYKSYIQRRRVGQSDSPPSFDAETQEDKSPIAELDDDNLFKDFNFNKSDKNDEELLSFHKTNDDSDDINYNYEPRVFAIPPPSRSTYRKESLSNKSKYSSNNNGTNSPAIEDNKVAKLSVKVIKQALACFAILGIIVFLQQRSDTTAVLDFLRTNIVDNHTDLQGLTSGVKDIITECTKIFNGLP